jgi:hypothetical protein
MNVFKRWIEEMPMSAVASFTLRTPGIDMRQPFRFVAVSLQPEAGDECFIAANDDHDEEVCDHDHIDQPQNGKHDLFFLDVGAWSQR